MKLTYNYLLHYIQGNRRAIEIGKLITIALFALVSLFISIYFLYFSPYTGFRFVYVFIPHLYLIPIILLALWYPNSGVRLVILILASLFAFWILSSIFGYSFPPLFMILYTGIDLAIFVVFLLYVKDRRLVEAVILDIIERSASKSVEFESDSNRFCGDFDAIITALGSEDEGSREEAVSALSDLGGDRVIFPLITTLRDKSPYVRRSAAEALGHSESPKAVRPLIDALADDDRYVRETSAEALGHLGKVAMPEIIKRLNDPDWRIRVGGVIALRLSIPSPETDVVIRLLHDDSVYVRREAVKTLGRIGDSRILPYIIEATNDPDPGVRLRGLRAVARIGTGEEVMNVLKRCMQDPDSAVRIRANEEYQRKIEKMPNFLDSK